MFTYVRLKNFKSFGDIVFDFRKKRNPETFRDVKQFIALYGENGSGKSDFAESINFLSESAYAFCNVSCSKGTDRMFMSHKTLDCAEPSEVEYGILANGKELRYGMKFTHRLIEEELSIANDESGESIFRIYSGFDGSIYKDFRSDIFSAYNERKFITDEIEKYWGAYSLLSIIVYLIGKYKYSSPDVIIPEYILDLDVHLTETRICVRKRKDSINTGVFNKYILEEPFSGTISRMDMQLLKNTEKILNSFFTQAYGEIKSVTYVAVPDKDGGMQYTLYAEKAISGSVFRIPFECESEGTCNITELLRCLVHVFNGETAVCDGVENGIHDILLDAAIASAMDEVENLSVQAEKNGQQFTGQLIMTSHNTYLMDSFDASDIYFIKTDYRGNKEAICIDDYGVKRRDDKRLKYLNGLFHGGVPVVESIDYKSITA